MAAAAEVLRRDGVLVLNEAVPADLVAALRVTCQSGLNRRVDYNDQVHDGAIDLDVLRPQGVKYQVGTSHLLGDEVTRSILLDKGLLQIAQAYIGGTPSIDIVTGWYSFPTEKASSEAAQLFHFDLERIKWLKVFLYLTDTTAETGAHVFIPSSHQDGAIPNKLLKKGYSRLDDEVIDSHFPREKWATVVGKPGTIVLEDTRGLHKGTRLLRDHRLLIQFQYSLSLFGHNRINVAPDSLNDDADWVRMRTSNPELFSTLQ